MYHVGDYVYVEPAEPNLQPHIIYIERLWQDDTGQSRDCIYQTMINVCSEEIILYFKIFLMSSPLRCSTSAAFLLSFFFPPLINAGEKWLYGCWFYRPNETFHLATRKFLEKEVFKSDYYNKAPVSKILGKCVVMFVKVSTMFVLCVWYIYNKLHF